MLLTLVSLAVLCHMSAAQVTGFGACPKVPVQTTLDRQRYLGLWYEIERFPAIFEGDNCGTANYTVNAAGNIGVENRYIEDGVMHNAMGEAKQNDPSQPGLLAVSFSNTGAVGDYRVVETDYDTYTLIFSCRDLAHIVYAEFAWILTRDPKPDPAIVQRLKTKLGSYNVDVSKFQVTNQTACPQYQRITGLPVSN